MLVSGRVLLPVLMMGKIQQLMFHKVCCDDFLFVFLMFDVFVWFFRDVCNHQNGDFGMVPVLSRPVLFQQLPVVSITRCCL